MWWAFLAIHNGGITLSLPARAGHAGPAALPTRREAQDLARDLLGDEGTRYAHVLTAGRVAVRLALLFDDAEAELLVVAATLHDIGYSRRIAHRGFHPWDGATFLRAEGYPERLARLVAHHSLAHVTAEGRGIVDLADEFPREDSLLADALAYADMHAAPDGRLIRTETRLAGIAARHPERVEAERARQLRGAITRVGSALLKAAPAPERPRTVTGPPIPAPRVPARTRTAFDLWWRAETQYQLVWQRVSREAPRAPARREDALRLARLRSRADQRRDRYFRAALG